MASEGVKTPVKTTNGVTEQKSLVWSRDRDLKLLSKIEEHLNGLYKKKNVFMKDIIWSAIAFDDYNEHEVQKRFNTLTSKIRKLRTAREILEDAKSEVAEDEPNRKRKRDENGPTQPKMPKTAYLLFCEHKRPRLVAKYSTLSNQELTLMLGKKWQKLSDEKKQTYKDMYCENRQQYKRDLTQYFVETNPQEMPPKTAFDLWSEEKAAEIKKSRPDISEKKLKKKLNKYWERLEDKEKWEEKATKESEQFIKKMKKKAYDAVH